MRLLITSLLMLLCSSPLLAQSLTINESSAAKDALLKIEASRKYSSQVNGYRVGIFFDNGQNARSNALEARSKFKENFPGEPIYMLYESPYYKVSVGNCLTEEEAIILFERVKGVFPNAYVMREMLKLNSFIQQPNINIEE
ncbi:MAG: hypothetical protein SNI51_06110 [Rikenellaceae bacterium]